MSLERRYALLSALRWLPIGITLPFLTLVPLARGLSLTAVGVVFAVHGIVIFLCEVPSGALADAIGRKRTLLAGGVLTTISVATFGVATGVAAFAAAFVAMGVGRALISGALEAWFVDTIRAADPNASLREGLAAGLAANGLALGGGALLGGAVPLLFGDLPARGGDVLIRYSPAFAVAAAAGLLYVAAVALLVHEPPRRTPASLSLTADLQAIFTGAVREARQSRTVRLVLAVAFTFGLGLSAWELLWQPRLAAIVGGASDDTFLFGALAAAGMLAGTAAAWASVRVAKRIGAGPTYTAGFALFAVMLVVLSLADTGATFAAAYVAAAFVMALGEPLHYEFLHEAVEDRARATLVSIESLALQLGAVVTNLGLARLADAEGIDAAWYVAAGVLLVGALLAARVAASSSVPSASG